MKVFIGPYKSSETFFNRIINFIKGSDRNIKVKIHEYDTWSLDHTLSYIIYPLLVKFKEMEQHSFAFVDDEDVPEHLKLRDVYDEERDIAKWQYTVDEMIYSFKTLSEDVWDNKYYSENDDGTYNFDKEGYDIENNRINNGLRLFAKYYRHLWS